jgi:dihydroflavonol-4-reductase
MSTNDPGTPDARGADLSGRTVAVTGATGFLGRYLVEGLLRSGARVIGVVRNPDKAAALREQGVELRCADLTERDRLRTGFAGTDAIVSNAALLAVSGMLGFRRRTRETYLRVNVEGTRNVLEAAAEAGVRRVVQISSVGAYQSPRRHTPESHPLRQKPGLLFPNVYGLSKALAEQLAWQVASELGLALTTIRPGPIYGAFDGTFMPVARTLLGPAVSVWPSHLRMQLVHAGDVAHAVVLAVASPAAVGKAYNVVGDEHTLWQFARAWREAGGRRAGVLVPVPLPIGPLFSNELIKRELGWSNRTYLEGLQETFAKQHELARAQAK